MSPEKDPIDEYIPELRALLRRIYQEGEVAALKRVMAAARSADTAFQRFTPEPVLPGIAPFERKKRARKYEYGLVKKAVTKALRSDQASEGMSRGEIVEATFADTGVRIDEKTIKNTLKSMMRAGEAKIANGLFFPGSKLKTR